MAFMMLVLIPVSFAADFADENQLNETSNFENCRDLSVDGECRDLSVDGECCDLSVDGECCDLSVDGECCDLSADSTINKLESGNSLEINRSIVNNVEILHSSKSESCLMDSFDGLSDIQLDNVNTNSSTSKLDDNNAFIKMDDIWSSSSFNKIIYGYDSSNKIVYEPNLLDLQNLINMQDLRKTIDLNQDINNKAKESRIIDIHKDLTIDGHGLTIDFGNCKNSYIDISAGNVVFKNINFINGFNDKSDNGGALYIHKNAIVTIINCSFNGNFASKSGGAVYSENKNKLTIINSIFQNNKAEGKGGAVFSKGEIIISSSNFTHNHAKEDGGAVYSESKVYVNGSIFDSNDATGKSHFQNYGGAICSKGDVTLVNSQFKSNKADDYGGAIYSFKSIISINEKEAKSIFINNYAADEHGGAIYAEGNVDCQYVVFENNKAEGKGGAVFSKGKVYIKDAIIKKNNADSGPAVYAKYDIIVNNSALNLNYNGKSQLEPFHSEKGKINLGLLPSEYVKSAVAYDNFSSVDLNKRIVNFWINDGKELKELFKFITNNDPSWKIINITLAPNTIFKVNYKTFSSGSLDFALHVKSDVLFINGNPGSVIVGNEHNNNFLHISKDSNVFFYDVNLECFNHCILNAGNFYAFNSSFCDNKFHIADRNKNSGWKNKEVYGGVMINYNNAWFEDCHLIGNQAVYDDSARLFKKTKCWGSILFTSAFSQTYFKGCNYYKSGNAPFYANDYSTIILIQDHELKDEFDDSYIYSHACLCTISLDAYEKGKNYVHEINCSNVDELKKALYMVNSRLPGLNIVINLKAGVYNLEKSCIQKTSVLRSFDWRDEFYHPSRVLKKTPNYDVFFRYAMDVGMVPITINGNGATINVKGNDDSDMIGFADVGYGGKLILNNLTLSHFNRALSNYGGTILANNCTFKDNQYYCGKPVLHGCAKSRTYFTNCAFKPVDGRCADSNIFTLEGESFVKFESCDFDFSKGTKNIGNLKDSKIECPYELKTKVWFNGYSIYVNPNDTHINKKQGIVSGSVLLAFVDGNGYENNLSDMINKTSADTLIINISRDCEIDLMKIDFKGNIIINGNNFNVSFVNANGSSTVIDKNTVLTLNNLTFSHYDSTVFVNKGTINMKDCAIKNNTCDYLIENQWGFASISNSSYDNMSNVIFNHIPHNCIFDNCSLADC